MSAVADVNGIWVADENTPIEKCGILPRQPEWKKDNLQKFPLLLNKDFKLVCWVTGTEAGRRIYFKAALHKSSEATSQYDLGMAHWIDVTERNKNRMDHVDWKWPKAANWKEPGVYEVKVWPGYSATANLQDPPKWESPVSFVFEVVNK